MSREPASVVEAFLQMSERVPDKLCLRFQGKAMSYAELRRSAEAFAAGLCSWGLRRGERVALWMENSPDFLAAYLSIHLVGGAVVPINTQYRQWELHHILSDAAVRLCFVDEPLRPELAHLERKLPGLELVVETGAPLKRFLIEGQPYRGRLPESEDLALIAYTSGTTGRSKGAMLLHRNLLANIRAISAAWRWTADDHLLLTLPLFHMHGLLVGANGTFVSGGSIELHRDFSVVNVYDALLAGSVTMFFGVPTMYTRLLAEAGRRHEKPPPLRLYVSGSAPLSAQTFVEFEQAFGQHILERYGLTETGMNTTNPYDGDRRPGTVGVPFPGQEARVVHPHTREPLPPDTDGEIEVRGPHVFKGYWNQPEATAECFTADGWFRTGDLGHVSGDGYFTITGRAKELIISGGYNVYPREVEEVLQGCPGVAEVAVVGLPHPELGEQVAAAIVRSDLALTAEEVIAFCRNQLASYKKPRHVVFVDALPRNAMGKIQKYVLSKQLGETLR